MTMHYQMQRGNRHNLQGAQDPGILCHLPDAMGKTSVQPNDV